MGQERSCRIDYLGNTFEGKALLETSELVFRGGTRLKIPFRKMTRVEAADGKLRIVFPPSEATFHVGDVAERWASKILNPPSRLDKLGITSGTRLRWIGLEDREFRMEVEQHGAVFVRSKADLTFVAASSIADLDRLGTLQAPIGVVYPKGVEPIREADVLQAGRAAGLTDVKVTKFSDTHTALKFVARKAARES
jgi:hypothetical protein